jgi:hypothetical protein
VKREDTLRVADALGLVPSGHNGEWINYPCPFAPYLHKNGTDNSPSFGIRVGNHEHSSYACQGCHKSGSIVHLIQALGQFRGNIDYDLMQAARDTELGAALTVEFSPFDRPYGESEPALVPLNESVYKGLWPDAWDEPHSRQYLISRGVNERTSRSLGLLYRDRYTRNNRNGRGTHDWMRHDILFPVRDRDGKLYGWSGRTTVDCKPKIFDENLPKRHLILGEHRWRHGHPKIIVEGLFGYAHLIGLGVEEWYDVGALMGSYVTDEKASVIKTWGDSVALLVDNDQAGDQCLFGPINNSTGERDQSKSAIRKLYGSVVVIVPEWPEGKSDPDRLSLEEVHDAMRTTPYYIPRKNKKT